MTILAAEGSIDTRVQIVAIVITVLLFGLVLELVRRRRLVERYALLWMSAALALLVLAVWRDLLDIGSDFLGIAVPANALFLVAFAVIFVLLLHFSVATSRLGDETKILAQEVARLDEQQRRLRTSLNGDAAGNGPRLNRSAKTPRRAARAPATSRRPAPSAAARAADAPQEGRRQLGRERLGELPRPDRPPRLDLAPLAQQARQRRSVSAQARSFCPAHPPASETKSRAISVSTSAGAISTSSAAG